MCGFAGLLGALAPDLRRERLAHAVSLLAHRGPDGDGFHEEPRVALGFRRLAIVDLACGAQPMYSEDRGVVSVCNGEIYNFATLRAELQAAGHTLRTRCDAEVIPHLYEQHGDGFLSRLNGMFALAVWDAKRGRLLLARDRMGEKPLYYRPAADGIAFASGLASVAALAGVEPALDRGSLERYLAFLCVPAPHTIYAGFRQLPPASFLVAEAGRPPGEPRRWWSLPPSDGGPATEGEASEQFWSLLVDSVALRRLGDLPVGVFLSGGIDSSAVALAMRESYAGPLRTFTVSFPGDGVHDEAAFAQAVATQLGTEHRVLPSPCDDADLASVAAAFDEPFGDPSAWPTWQVCRAARAHGKVVLGGDGGDELLAGYRWTLDHLRWLGTVSRVPRPLVDCARGALDLLVPEPERRPGLFARAARGLSYTGTDRRTGYLRKYTCFPPAMRARLLGRPHPGFANDPLALEVLARLGDERPPDGNDLLAVDLGHYLPSDILVKVDRASMAHGLEMRSPFLDHRLVEAAFRMPFAWKLSAAGESKRLLKIRLRGCLPDAVLAQRKQGFGFPVDAWLRGPLRRTLEEVLLDPGLRMSGHTDPLEVRRWVREHLQGRQALGSQLWGLLMLELWMRRSP